MSDMEHYASYFSVGMKVGVVIPMANAESFRDWAIIHELDEDLVTLQLSRDQLPESIHLHVGQILELRCGKEGEAYSCRAIIVSEGDASEVLLRLIGEIVTDELREFYRIDAFLPIKYYISKEQHPEVLESEWSTRRRQRLDDEMIRKQQRWESRLNVAGSDLPQERHQMVPSDEGDELDPSWDSIIPLAANISGGGVRIIAHHNFTVGHYVPLEILVPSPRRIVEAVGKVMFSNRNAAMSGDRESYNVALKFIFIDERDRDAIVNHIAGIQLQRIRQLREHFSLRSNLDFEDTTSGLTSGWKLFARKAVISIALVSAILLVYGYFQGYMTNPPKGEIAQTFEQGIKRYLERIGR